MQVDGKHFRSVWLEPDGWTVGAIDQRGCRINSSSRSLRRCEAAADAIRSMLVRGAPLIGATAAFGMALAMRAHASDAAIDRAYKTLDRDKADRDQPEMGARRDARDIATAAAFGACGRSLRPRRRHCRTGHRHQPGHRPDTGSP